MRTLLFLFSSIFIFAACAKEVQLVESTGASDPVVRSGKAVVEVQLTESELSLSPDRDTAVWEKARQLGLRTVFNKMLQKDTLFVPVDGMVAMDALDSGYSQAGMLTQTGDAETGDFIQGFEVSARFIGDLSVGGEIVTLEESAFVAGATDTTYAMLYNNVPPSLPAYVAIAEPVKEIGNGFYRLIGMGEVVETMENTARLPQERGGLVGRLCTVEIMVSNREVEAGDMVFLMPVHVAALDPTLPLPTESELDTVVVEPPHKDVVHAPKEQK